MTRYHRNQLKKGGTSNSSRTCNTHLQRWIGGHSLPTRLSKPWCIGFYLSSLCMTVRSTETLWPSIIMLLPHVRTVFCPWRRYVMDNWYNPLITTIYLEFCSIWFVKYGCLAWCDRMNARKQHFIIASSHDSQKWIRNPATREITA